MDEWHEYRLHLNALFSTVAQDERQRLLALLQKAEADWLRPATPDEGPGASGEQNDKPAPGVIWDVSRGRWRVRRQQGRSARVYGRFTLREDAEALAEAIRAYERDKGRLPPAGWRG